MEERCCHRSWYLLAFLLFCRGTDCGLEVPSWVWWMLCCGLAVLMVMAIIAYKNKRRYLEMKAYLRLIDEEMGM